MKLKPISKFKQATMLNKENLRANWILSKWYEKLIFIFGAINIFVWFVGIIAIIVK